MLLQKPRQRSLTSCFLLGFFVAGVAMGGSCSSEEEVAVPAASADQVTQLNSAQGRALIDSSKKVLVIDARPQGEYMSGHLVGAQSIDSTDEAAWKFRTTELDKSLTTVVYCSTAVCSENASAMLQTAGFTQVYDLGGIEEWDSSVLSVDKPN
ncbi:MAG: rhodanese-like domain-containing protein [Microthrixaceae bacterium]